MNTKQVLNVAMLRAQTVGCDAVIDTPFGERLMVYADYTASGRCLAFVERYLQDLQRIYANSHTEDDISGRSMTHLLDEAEQSIKRSVNAGPAGRIVPIGSGARAWPRRSKLRWRQTDPSISRYLRNSYRIPPTRVGAASALSLLPPT